MFELVQAIGGLLPAANTKEKPKIEADSFSKSADEMSEAELSRAERFVDANLASLNFNTPGYTLHRNGLLSRKAQLQRRRQRSS